MSTELTLPGDIPGLLRRGSPVIDDEGDRLVLARTYTDEHNNERAWCAECGEHRYVEVWGPLLSQLALDLTDATGRAHAAWWMVTHDEYDMEFALALDAHVSESLKRAECGAEMTGEQIDTLRRLALHVAGRADG